MRCETILQSPSAFKDVFNRVNYYYRGDEKVPLDALKQTSQDVEHFLFESNSDILSIKAGSYYRYDMARYLSFFSKDLMFSMVFGDVNFLPENKAIVKSRPVESGNEENTGVIMKLDALRHFRFISDTLAFREKKKRIVWRGHRLSGIRDHMVNQFHDHELCDIKQVGATDRVGLGEFLSIKQQLAYRYVLSLEGVDVATNLKFIMFSRSLCFMPAPRFETWFLEGALEAGVHYVEINRDGSDLIEKIQYYNAHVEEAEAIIDNANKHCLQFLDRKKEDLISFLVLEKFYHLTGQKESIYAPYFC